MRFPRPDARRHGLPRALLRLHFREAVLSRDGDWRGFLARAVHLVLGYFGEDGRLFEEDLHVHEARVLTLTTNDDKVRQSDTDS